MKTKVRLNPSNSTLPVNPGARVSDNRSPALDQSDYYVRTTVESLALKYSGRSKGMAVDLNREQALILERLRRKFGSNFGLNEIICFAYDEISNGVSLNFDKKTDGADASSKKNHVQAKP